MSEPPRLVDVLMLIGGLAIFVIGVWRPMGRGRAERGTGWPVDGDVGDSDDGGHHGHHGGHDGGGHGGFGDGGGGHGGH